MYKGIYIALSGAQLKQRHLDITAQNIANSSTSGYKKERISFKEHIVAADNNSPLVNEERVMTEISDIATDFSSGGLIRTGNPLDFAIDGDGFFALEGDKYTRNGQFRVSPDGDLESADGIKVLGDGGPITIQGTRIEVSDSGEILVDDVSVGKLKVVDFADRKGMLKMNGTLFSSDQPAQEVDAHISQGYLESSNVEVVREMVQMINSLREFETYQRIIRSFDDAASKTINEMGK